MTENTYAAADHTAKAQPLTSPRRVRPPWQGRLARLAVLAGLCALTVRYNPGDIFADLDHTCETAHKTSSKHTLRLCQLAYQRNGDPSTGVRLATALRTEGDNEAAKTLAVRLLATPARPDSLYLLGRIAQSAGKLESAVLVLEAAREAHLHQQRLREVALDDGELATARTDRHEYIEALRLLDECIDIAKKLPDLRVEHYCHTVAIRTLVEIGHFPAAKNELDEANRLGVASSTEQINLDYQRTNILQETGYHATASVILKRLLRQVERSSNHIRSINFELNLAYSLAEQGLIDEATRHLRNATARDANGDKEMEIAWTAARIASKDGDLAGAASQIDRYFHLLGANDSHDRGVQIEVATLGSQIALERGDLQGAERLARRAVETAEVVRNAQTVLELRPWTLTKRRPAYEALFAARAGARDFVGAALAFNDWQGRTMQDALTRPSIPASDLAGVIAQLTEVDEWLKLASQAPFAPSADQTAILSTMHEIDLLALIVANNAIWRLTVNHGPPRLDRVAMLTDLESRILSFHDRPTDPLASALGELLLPRDLFRKTQEALHVLIDGRLGGLPIAALRRDGTPLIAVRPIVHVLRLPERRCVPAPRPGPATVLAYSKDNLKGTKAEGEHVSKLLGTTAKMNGAAVRAELFAAAAHAVLHVAGHGRQSDNGGAIALADGDVSAMEISAHRVAPALAVLSTCASALPNAKDTERAGAVATGFLAAGSQHVVAPLRSISDQSALEVSKRFYAAGGVTDPVRALASALAAMAEESSNPEWPYFAVFGSDICQEGSQSSEP